MSSVPRGGRRVRRVPVTALFDSAGAVERALERLIAAGLPRDLVEVAVSPSGAERYYKGRGRRNARDTFRYAGVGGILGLVAGAVISIVLVALPGFQDPGVMAWVQLLGPNLATISGAILGAVFGWFKRRSPSAWHVRLDDREDAILVAALARGEAEIGAVTRILAEAGAREIEAEPRWT